MLSRLLGGKKKADGVAEGGVEFEVATKLLPAGVECTCFAPGEHAARLDELRYAVVVEVDDRLHAAARAAREQGDEAGAFAAARERAAEVEARLAKCEGDLTAADAEWKEAVALDRPTADVHARRRALRDESEDLREKAAVLRSQARRAEGVARRAAVASYQAARAELHRAADAELEESRDALRAAVGPAVLRFLIAQSRAWRLNQLDATPAEDLLYPPGSGSTAPAPETAG